MLKYSFTRSSNMAKYLYVVTGPIVLKSRVRGTMSVTIVDNRRKMFVLDCYSLSSMRIMKI